MAAGQLTDELPEFHKSFVEGINTYRQIDFVLNYIRDNSDTWLKLYVSRSDLETYIIHNRAVIGIKRQRLGQIIDKLAKDGYILIRGDHRIYDITLEGVIFQGYEKQYLDKINVEKRQNRRETYLIVGSWMAGLGAMLLVLVELVKKLDWVLSINALTAWFLFSLGICTGVTALLIADKVLQQRSK